MQDYKTIFNQFDKCDLIPYTQSLTFKKGISAKTGNEYYYIDLVLKNGYQKMIFVDQALIFPLQNLFSVLEQKPNTSGEQIPVSIS